MKKPELRGLQPTFDIFVGGPMNQALPDGAGSTLDRHLPNLISAVKSIAKKINADLRATIPELDYDIVTVNGPPAEIAGEIPKRVFELIDEADLGILDMSGPVTDIEPSAQFPQGERIVGRSSSNVIYELAFLHGLGVPTIPIALKGTEPIFYLKHSTYKFVEDFSTKSLRRALEQAINSLVRGPVEDTYRTNPISDIYKGVALVDISSATGLATGYFHNFLANVISTERNIFDDLDGVDRPIGRLDTLVILKPRNLAEVKVLRKDLDARLKAIGKEKTAAVERLPPGSDRRPSTYTIVENYIVDVMQPLAAMAISHRYERARKMAAKIHKEGGRQAEYRIQTVDEKIIERFESTLFELAENPGTDARMINTMTLDEFIDRLKSETPPAATP